MMLKVAYFLYLLRTKVMDEKFAFIDRRNCLILAKLPSVEWSSIKTNFSLGYDDWKIDLHIFWDLLDSMLL